MTTVVRRFAILLVALATTACALTNTGNPSTAAIVGDQTVPVSRIDEQFERIRATDAYQEQAQQDPSGQIAAQAQTRLVTTAVQEALLRLAGERNGVEVTEQQIDAGIAQLEDQLGGPEELQRQLDEAGLSQRDLRKQIENQQIQQALQQQAGADADFAQFIRDTVDDVSVDVNPRYGAWDSQSLQIQPIDPLAPSGAQVAGDAAQPVQPPEQ